MTSREIERLACLIEAWERLRESLLKDTVPKTIGQLSDMVMVETILTDLADEATRTADQLGYVVILPPTFSQKRGN